MKTETTINHVSVIVFNKMLRTSINNTSHPPPVPHHHGPPLLGPPMPTAHLQQAVLRGIEENRGTGSGVAYDSARQEYREFCESLYPNDEFKFLVNDEKAFLFMFYTAMREQKPRGGN